MTSANLGNEQIRDIDVISSFSSCVSFDLNSGTFTRKVVKKKSGAAAVYAQCQLRIVNSKINKSCSGVNVPSFVASSYMASHTLSSLPSAEP